MIAPGQVRFNVTPALRRALAATNARKVTRTYGANGNVLTCAGVSSRVLWTCVAHHLIEDEPGTSSGSATITCRMRLTRAGLAILGAMSRKRKQGESGAHEG